MSVLLVLLTAGVLSALLLTPGSNRDAPQLLRASYQYQNGVAPPFLSEGMAIEAAFNSLTSSGHNWNGRTLVQGTNRNDKLAPDGSQDAFLMRTPPGDPNTGVVIIESYRDGEPALIVRLRLQGSELTATIAPAR